MNESVAIKIPPLFAAVLLMVSAGALHGETGEEVLEKVERVLAGPKDYEGTASMVLSNTDGSRRETRELKIWSAGKDKRVIKFLTDVALRTLSEALATAACKLLEIESSELMAEYRPALTQPGAEGRETEIFLYDTLPGGAGFASQLPEHGAELFSVALDLMKDCPEDCDVSCYRCLRSFKNKFEHALLDRHVGTELLEYLVTGGLPPFNEHRLSDSIGLLHDDIERNGDDLTVRANIDIEVPGVGRYTAPIHIRRKDGAEFSVVVSGPMEVDYPSDPVISNALDQPGPCRIIPMNELQVRGNLADATNEVLAIVRHS